MSDLLASRETVYADDLHEGLVLEIGAHEVTAAEIVSYAEQWDPQWFHVDEVASETGPYSGLIGSGIHTIAIFQKLFVGVSSNWAAISGKGLQEVRFLRPLRPGTTVTGSVRILSVRMEDDRRRGLVRYAGELIDSDSGKSLLTLQVEAYLHQSPSSTETQE